MKWIACGLTPSGQGISTLNGRNYRRRSVKWTPIEIAVSFALLLALLLALSWPSKYMVSRDIGCAKFASPRGRAICGSLADSMEWTWLGHATVSPGWRPTWDGLREVWCHEKISQADLRELEILRESSDWRLQDAADDLIRLIHNGDEPPNSMFNARNSQYILRRACR